MPLFDAVKRVARITHNYGPLPVRAFQGQKFGEKFEPAAATGSGARTPSKLEEYFDANETGPGIWKWRHYFDVYHQHFEKFVGTSPTILEIGIYSGGSLQMWHEYFGPGTRVIGVDIAEECLTYEDENTKVYIGDQADPDFWREVIAKEPKIDLVVDDGGHMPYQQIATLKALLPNMSPGGVFICEDLQRKYNPFVSFAFGLVRNLNERHYGEPNSVQRHIDSVAFHPYITAVTRRSQPLEEIIAPKHGTEWQPFLGDRHLQGVVEE